MALILWALRLEIRLQRGSPQITFAVQIRKACSNFSGNLFIFPHHSMAHLVQACSGRKSLTQSQQQNNYISSLIQNRLFTIICWLVPYNFKAHAL